MQLMLRLELFFVFCLSVYSSNVMEKASGHRFEDLFNEFDDSIWQKIEDRLDCESHHQCIFIKEDNIELHTVQGIKKTRPKASELHLTIRNDCEESECCAEEYCTPYTAGMLVSRNTYGYGSFKWQARAINTNGYNHNYHDVWSCMSIEHFPASAEDGVSMGFSTCIPSESPRHAAFIWNYNETMIDSVELLPINAGRRFATFRIDWTPKYAAWYVNGMLMKMIESTNVTFPDRPLHIKASVIPQRPNLSIEPRASVADMDLTFRVRSIKADLEVTIDYDNDKTELFTNDKTELFTFSNLSFLLTIVILIAFAWFAWGMTRDYKMDSNGFYAPLNHESFL